MHLDSVQYFLYIWYLSFSNNARLRIKDPNRAWYPISILI